MFRIAIALPLLTRCGVEPLEQQSCRSPSAPVLHRPHSWIALLFGVWHCCCPRMGYEGSAVQSHTCFADAGLPEQGWTPDHAKADWQFTTADARVKLKRLYPSI
jgi:hypothetical protein